MRDTGFVDSRGTKLIENDEVMFMNDGMTGQIGRANGLWKIFWKDGTEDILVQYWQRILKT